MDTLPQLIKRLFGISQKQPVPPAEPADFIIERYSRYQPSWGNSRITYRIRHWVAEDGRYHFEGEHFWIQNVYRKLQDLGVAEPETVPIVDIEPQRG